MPVARAGEPACFPNRRGAYLPVLRGSLEARAGVVGLELVPDLNLQRLRCANSLQFDEARQVRG